MRNHSLITESDLKISERGVKVSYTVREMGYVNVKKLYVLCAQNLHRGIGIGMGEYFGHRYLIIKIDRVYSVIL